MSTPGNMSKENISGQSPRLMSQTENSMIGVAITEDASYYYWDGELVGARNMYTKQQTRQPKEKPCKEFHAVQLSHGAG